MISPDAFIHQLADVLEADIGDRTRVWQFVVILNGTVIGKDCNICSNVFIDEDVVLGDRVTVKNLAGIGAGARIGNDVFVGPGAKILNDPFPRSKVYPDTFTPVTIEDGASIGAGAVILPGRRIGTGAMIGAGAVVVDDVEPFSLIVGNPGRVVRKLGQGT